MEIPLKLEEDQKYVEILRILSNIRYPGKITPYYKLRNREIEVLAILFYLYNEKYSSIPEKERNTLIFSYESRQEIADRLSGRGTPVSKYTIYNIMMDLRKKGLIGSKAMIPHIIIPNIEKITLKFP